MSHRFDVLVIGEVLIELAAPTGLDVATHFELGFSGDALNAAAAASAAGARTALLTRVGDDEMGERLIAAVATHGVDPALIKRVRAPNGAYMVGADPTGEQAFVYLRAASAASTLEPGDLDLDLLASVGALIVSGVTQAISDSGARTVVTAAQAVSRAGGLVVYDPNVRLRLTTPAAARAALQQVAPSAAVVTPSASADVPALFPGADPVEAARRIRALGARAVAVTCGADGVILDAEQQVLRLPAASAPDIVDQTGAGDVLTGTLAARLALGTPLAEATRLGTAAAALALGGRGGAGAIAAFEDVERHLATQADTPR